MPTSGVIHQTDAETKGQHQIDVYRGDGFALWVDHEPLAEWTPRFGIKADYTQCGGLRAVTGARLFKLEPSGITDGSNLELKTPVVRGTAWNVGEPSLGCQRRREIAQADVSSVVVNITRTCGQQPTTIEATEKWAAGQGLVEISWSGGDEKFAPMKK